jgi:iron(III) transport system ATP-binding protein
MLFVTHDQVEALGLANITMVMAGGTIVQAGKPREIYETPVSAFVAGFVGRANLLDGVIEGSAARTAAGLVPVERLDGQRPGDRVVVSLRGEQLRLDPEHASAGVPGVVRARSYRGDAFDHLVDVGGVELRARTDPSVSVRPGTRVRVRVVGSAVIWTAR